MERKDYLKPEVQETLRGILTNILVEENLSLKDIAEKSGLSYQMVYLFLSANKRIGKAAVTRFLHFITLYGYDASTLKRTEYFKKYK